MSRDDRPGPFAHDGKYFHVEPAERPTHGFGWKDDEMVQIASCHGAPITEHFVIDIYEWRACPKCGKELKLVQTNDVLMREPS